MSAGHQSQGVRRNGFNNGGRRPTMVFSRSKPRQPSAQMLDAENSPTCHGMSFEGFERADNGRTGNQFSAQASKDAHLPHEFDVKKSRVCMHEKREESQQFNGQKNARGYSGPARNPADSVFCKNVSPSSIVMTDGKPECSVDSRPNVWKERARLYHDALPKNTDDEERMLNEALMISSKHYEEEQILRGIINTEDNLQTTTELLLPLETSIANPVDSNNVSMYCLFKSSSFSASGASGDDGINISPDISVANLTNSTPGIHKSTSANVQLHSNPTAIEGNYPAFSLKNRSTISPDMEAMKRDAHQFEDVGLPLSNLAVKECILTCDMEAMKLDAHQFEDLDLPLSNLPVNERILTFDMEAMKLDANQFEDVELQLSNLPFNERRILTCDEAEEYLHGNKTAALVHHYPPVVSSPPHDIADKQICFDLSSFSSVDSGFSSDVPKTMMNSGILSSVIEPPAKDVEARFTLHCKNQLENVPVTNVEAVKNDCEIISEDRRSSLDKIVVVGDMIDGNQYVHLNSADPPKAIFINDSSVSEEETVVEEQLNADCCSSYQCNRIPGYPEKPSGKLVEGDEENACSARPTNMVQYPGMSYFGCPAYPYGYGYPGGPMTPVPFMMAPGMGFVPPGAIMMPGMIPYPGMMPYERFPVMQAAGMPGMMMQPVMMMMMPSHPIPRLQALDSSSSNDN